MIRIVQVINEGVKSYLVKNEDNELGCKLLAVFHDDDSSGQALIDAIEFSKQAMNCSALKGPWN